jgi:hypothetical protein
MLDFRKGCATEGTLKAGLRIKGLRGRGNLANTVSRVPACGFVRLVMLSLPRGRSRLPSGQEVSPKK